MRDAANSGDAFNACHAAKSGDASESGNALNVRDAGKSGDSLDTLPDTANSGDTKEGQGPDPYQPGASPQVRDRLPTEG